MSSAQLAAASSTRTSIAAGPHTLAALQWGPGDGVPALLVPGYTGSKEDFGPILHRLAGAGFRVTAIDLPGQYESPWLPEPADYSPERLAPIVSAAARSLGPSVHLLGHSYGGLVARATVIADPGSYASLVLMDSGPDVLPGQRRMMIEQLEPVLASGGVPLVYQAMLAAQSARRGYVAPPAALADFLRRRFLAGDPAMLRGMGDALRSEPDRVQELAEVIETAGLETLVLFGADDDAWSPSTQTAMAARLRCGAVEIADAAHSPAVESPQATADALIEFWSRLG